MPPDLSVIVPLFNEALGLGALFDALSAQEGLCFEVVFCDGGSTDESLTQGKSLARDAPFPCRFLRTEKGRGRQMNAGAEAAKGRTFLFLHADSQFSDPRALQRSLKALQEAIACGGNARVAGHFRLRFSRRGNPPPALPYYFYEWKARLPRAECTHGDQGLLLPRTFFEEVGPFDVSLPFLEDTRLAEAIRRRGRWLLLPAEILTSARRFETEGFFERQVLNAILRAAAAVGWTAFFRDLAGLYRSQDHAGRLRLYPFFRDARELLRALGPRERLALWGRIGRYVAGQAWQLAFALDVRRHFRCGTPVGEGTTPWLTRFDWLFPYFIDHPPGRWAVAAFVWLSFHLFRQWSRFREGRNRGRGPGG